MDALRIYHKLIITYKNEPLLLALSGCVEEKKGK